MQFGRFPMESIEENKIIYTYFDASKTELIVGTNTNTDYENAYRKEDPPIHVVIPEYVQGKKVIRIGNCSFGKSVNIKSVVIPATIKSIGFDAFAYSTLKEVRFCEGSELESIEQGAFFSLSNIKEIRIPPSVKQLEEFVFGNCNYINLYYCGNTLFDSLNLFGNPWSSDRYYPKKIFVKVSYGSNTFGELTPIRKTSICSVPIHELLKCTTNRRSSISPLIFLICLSISK